MKYVWLALIAQYFFNMYFLIKIFILSEEIRDLKWQIKYLLRYLMRNNTIRSGRKAI